MRYFRLPQTKAAIGMVDDVKDAFHEKTDSKAIMLLMRWGYIRMFGKNYKQKDLQSDHKSLR